MKKTISKVFVFVAMSTMFLGLMGCEITVKDADGNKYPTVKIGQWIWMAKNLNVNVPGSMCYGNNPANCEKYGRLYTWEAAKKACPSGWHLPSGKIQKWIEEAGVLPNDLASSGFSALPAGFYRSEDKDFLDLGLDAYFWTSTFWDDKPFADGLIFKDDVGIGTMNKNDGLSVRCVREL